MPDPAGKTRPLQVEGIGSLAAIAQLVEHLIRNEGVGGSNPSCGTNELLRVSILRSAMGVRNLGLVGRVGIGQRTSGEAGERE